MIPAKSLRSKQQHGKNRKNRQGNHFLNDLELPEIKRAAVFRITDPVGGNLKTVFKQGDSPTKQNDSRQTPVAEPVHFFKFQMPVPGKSHKYIRED